MLQDTNTHLAERPGGQRSTGRPWWLRKVAGLLLIAACTDLLFACIVPVAADTHARTGIDDPIGARTAVVLARQDEGAVPADPPGQITATDGQEATEMNSKTSPPQPEPDDRRPFTPSEAIEAGQAVDFPYDI